VKLREIVLECYEAVEHTANTKKIELSHDDMMSHAIGMALQLIGQSLAAHRPSDSGPIDFDRITFIPE
jgi:hypothetical protein